MEIPGYFNLMYMYRELERRADRGVAVEVGLDAAQGRKKHQLD